MLITLIGDFIMIIITLQQKPIIIQLLILLNIFIIENEIIVSSRFKIIDVVDYICKESLQSLFGD